MDGVLGFFSLTVTAYPLLTDCNPRQAYFIKHSLEYAQSLYAALRQLDRLKLDVILVEQPPETEFWQAINDRLGKATVPIEF